MPWGRQIRGERPVHAGNVESLCSSDDADRRGNGAFKPNKCVLKKPSKISVPYYCSLISSAGRSLFFTPFLALPFYSSAFYASPFPISLYACTFLTLFLPLFCSLSLPLCLLFCPWSPLLVTEQSEFHQLHEFSLSFFLLPVLFISKLLLQRGHWRSGEFF